MIVKENNKYVIYSKKGKKLGEYNTKAEAVSRLRQIEYFKHLNKEAKLSQPTDDFHQKYILQNLDYANYLLQHKYNVAKAGIKMGLNPSNIILHDWSKFHPSLFLAYKNYFYGKGGVSDNHKRIDPEIYKNFRQQVEKHYLLEGHHKHIYNIPKSIQEEVESVADWWSVGKTNASISNKDFPDFKKWWDANKEKFLLSNKISINTYNYIENSLINDYNLFTYIINYLQNKWENILN